ncbi:MAG: VWA domain-containing protein [Microbacterium sp.]
MNSIPRIRRLGAVATAVVAVLLCSSPAAAASVPTAAAAQGESDTVADAKLVLLLDSSGSMADPDTSGAPRIDAARAALRTAIGSLDDDQQVGFRVFGAKEREDSPTHCTDSQLVVPIGAGNRDALLAATEGYQPWGETPIGYGLQQAGDDLGTTGQRSILLVSDGISTCDPDPCVVAAKLRAQGIDLTINVVGMNVDAKARSQLQCIADAGGGSYFDAHDAESLGDAMHILATRAFRPFTLAGESIEGAVDPEDAPAIEAGQAYVAEQKAEAVNFRMDRTIPGSTFHIGVIANPPAEVTSGWITAELLTPEGDRCGTLSGSPYSATDLAADEFTEEDYSGCADSDALILQVSGDDVAVPYQFEMWEEPPVRDADSLPPGDVVEDGWTFGGTVDGSGGEVVPGASFNDAPLLEPGSYRADFEADEEQFFRVHLEWGQSVRVRVDFDELGAWERGLLSTMSTYLSIHQPLGGKLQNAFGTEDSTGLSSFGVITDARADSLVAISPEVRWQNRNETYGEASYAGDYYLSLSTNAVSDSELFMIPYTITVEVVGTAGDGAPEYVLPEQQETVSPTPVATEKAESAADAGEDAEPLPLVLGLGLGGVLLVGGGTWALIRLLRRRGTASGT